MCVAVLDDCIKAAQVVAVGAGDLRGRQGVQNRLVVLVDEQYDALAATAVERLDQMAEAPGRARVAGGHSRLVLEVEQPVRHLGAEVIGFFEMAAGEAEPQHGMADRPVPLVVYREPAE